MFEHNNIHHIKYIESPFWSMVIPHGVIKHGNIVSDNGLLLENCKPLPQPILPYSQLDPKEDAKVNFENTRFVYQDKHWKMSFSKWRPFCQVIMCSIHDDVIKWKHFPRYWPFVRGIHRSPVNSRHKGQWRGALMFSLICTWINGWVNNRETGDLRRYRAHYDVTVMLIRSLGWILTCQVVIVSGTHCYCVNSGKTTKKYPVRYLVP